MNKFLFFLKRLINILFLDNNKISGYNVKDFGHLGNHCKIGADCILVPQNMFLDDYVIIQGRNNFVSFKGKLIIKKFSVISSSCIIVPSNHQISIGIPFYLTTLSHVGDDNHTIVVNEDVWIGAGCKLLPKSSFGRGCIVGAGSVITKEVPPYAVVAGCPARIISVKFSKEDIIRHEKVLYPSNERMSNLELDYLFEKYYKNITPIESYSYNAIEKVKLSGLVNELNIDINI